MSEQAKCQLCGEPMPAGEEWFNYHGYSGPCPKEPLSKEVIRTFTQAEVDAKVASALTETIPCGHRWANRVRPLLQPDNIFGEYCEVCALVAAKEKQAIASAEEATVLACIDVAKSYSFKEADQVPSQGIRNALLALLKTPGQLARYVEQAAKPLIVAAEEAVVQDYSKALANGPDAVKAWTDNFLKDRKDGISNLARREDEIRRQERWQQFKETVVALSTDTATPAEKKRYIELRGAELRAAAVGAGT